MEFKVIVVSPEEYEQGVADMQSVDPDEEPQDAVAQDGKALFEENSCMGCHAIGEGPDQPVGPGLTNFGDRTDRKSTRLNSSHVSISYAVFCLKKKIYKDKIIWRTVSR